MNRVVTEGSRLKLGSGFFIRTLARTDKSAALLQETLDDVASGNSRVSRILIKDT